MTLKSTYVGDSQVPVQIVGSYVTLKILYVDDIQVPMQIVVGS